MNNEQRKARLARWEDYRSSTYRRWRVYSTFLTGFLIGLLYVIIISKWKVPSQVFGGLIDQRTLILMFSGIMGGVIYTILVDGYVEMPRFVANKGDQFEAGLFGDILLGIAGAIVLDFLTQATPLSAKANIEVAALGIVGGYGGRAILQFALNRMFSDINVLEEDRQKYLKAAYQQKMEAVDGLKIIDQLNKHIQTGLTNSELAELTAAIRQAAATVRKQVFDLAKDFRRTANLSDVTKPRIERTIPIFEALIDSEPDNHQFYAEAAFAYKDSGSPDLFKAIQYLDKAIETRGDRHQADTWKYELSRAITRIQQAYQTQSSYNFDAATNDRIIEDLLAVARIYNLENILKSASEKNIPIPVWEWIVRNKTMLESREDTKNLVATLLQSRELLDTPHLNSKDNTVEFEKKTSLTPQIAVKTTQADPVVEVRKPEVASPKPELDAEITRWRKALVQAKPQGASTETAKQDGLSYSGVKASHKMAENDWPRVKPCIDRFWVAARRFKLPPELLAAIASRESRCGNTHLLVNGWGDHGNAFGIMQVDKNYHTVAGAGSDPASQEHINQATGILAGYIHQVRQKHSSWDDSSVLEGGCVAYNSGVDNVRTKERMNGGTTGDDYGADVIARAQFYSQYFSEAFSKELIPNIEAKTDKRAPSALPIHISESIPLTQLDQERAKWVQQQLKRGGYYTSELDGNIGEKSLTAFANFKEDFSLEYPEIIGPTTVQFLDSLEEPKTGINMRLSEHFTLKEMVFSETAASKGINNFPTDPVIIENLKALCQNILDPVRKHYGKEITPNSGYRCKALNDVLRGSSSTSQHMVGEAVDFNVPGVSVPEVCKWIRENLEFDQLIMEFYQPPKQPGWVHCSFKRNGGNRKKFTRIG